MKKLPSAVLIAGAPARYPDLRYATGFCSFDPVILLIKGKRRWFAVSPLDFDHVRRTVKNTRVISMADLAVPKNSKNWLAAHAAALLSKTGTKSVTIPPYFPVGLANALASRGFRTTVADQNLFPGREIKSAAEIEHITYAQKAALKAMDAAVDLIAGAKIERGGLLKIGNKPLTSEYLRAKIDETAREFDCICYGTIAAGGPQGANPHETGFGPLKAGEPIVIDIFPQHVKSGYWGDLTRTFIRGAPTARIKKLSAAVRGAQRAAIAKVKAGVKASVVHNAAVHFFEKRGFPAGQRHGRKFGFIHTLGHGVGLEVHEPPSVSPFGTELKAGNVVTIEPGLYYPGRYGFRMEDLVVVTRTGCRVIEYKKYPFVI